MRAGTWQNSGRLHSRTRSSGFPAKHSEAVGLFSYFTVCSYIILVSTPALALAFYYTMVWDPSYANKNAAPLIIGKLRANQTLAPAGAVSPTAAGSPQMCECPPSRSSSVDSGRNSRSRISLQNILASVTSPKPAPTGS
ncbi:hypothetical protein M3Y99_01169600 [Aphelenchoides fujianensis]|nr:hypothetical protein M3Y99_01169600 [Aphelenchoides fujianensis]